MRALYCVVDRDGRMGERAGVENDWRPGFSGLLNPGDEITLEIGLPEDKIDASGRATLRKLRADVVERRRAINLGLARCRGD